MRILLAGGGSGGSAAPVIAVAQAARRRWPDARMLYVGTRSGPEAALVRAAGLEFLAVRSGRLRRYATWRNLIDPAFVAAGVGQAFDVVRRFKPDVAFGAGGFATVPPLIAARLLGVPVITHQQDVIPGLANRILAPFARCLTIAFAETAALVRHRSVRVVGNPVREEILRGDAVRGRVRFGFSGDVPVVLVTGGGTGALRVNQLVAEAVLDLVKVAQVLHLTGAGKAVPAPAHPHYRQLEFLTEDMADALAAADVVVTRAGMSALTEIGALGKAAIVVPMPDSHQEANAMVVERHGAGLVAHERDLTAARLNDLVGGLIHDDARREALGQAARRLLPEAAADAVVNELAAVARPAA